MPVHVHGEEEEIFYVLAGGGLAWQKGEACPIGPGDVIVHRPNGRPHTLLAGDAGMTVLAFDSGSESGLSFLPRAGVMWAGPRWVPLDAPHPFRAEGLAGPLERPVVDPDQPRPANVVGLRELETERPSRLRALGRAGGAVKAGLNHVTLPAGATGPPPHVHSLEEELFYVLAGSGTVTLGADEHPLTAGDIVARPPRRVSRTASGRHRTGSRTWSTGRVRPATRSTTRRAARSDCVGSASRSRCRRTDPETMRAETRSITIQARPEDVLRFVADPFNLARWAPDFAPSVHERDGRWYIVGDFDEREIIVTASVECGTFDLWPASDPGRGIRTRVIANGDGSEYLVTLLADDELEPDALAEQLRVVEQELVAVRRLVQDG